MRLDLQGATTIEELMKSDEFKSFDEDCRKYHAAVYAEAIRELNVYEREQFDLWWNGTLYDLDSKKTTDAVLWACCRGCG